MSNQKPLILLVDDNPDFLWLFKSILGSNYDTLEACCPLKAIALADATAEPIDLIISDYDLGQLNGLKLCSRIRTTPQHKSTAVIICSGMNLSQQELSKHDIQYFVKKPFENFLLIEIVEHTLKTKGNSTHAEF